MPTPCIFSDLPTVVVRVVSPTSPKVIVGVENSDVETGEVRLCGASDCVDDVGVVVRINDYPFRTRKDSLVRWYLEHH
jgi:hypothetical protein